jgi:hypothetical protein
MKNVVTTARIAIVATAVLLVGAGAGVSSAVAEHHGTSSPATVTVAGPDEPACIACWE